MIIDVVDLQLGTLNFSQRYDTNRYKRGTRLYHEESVSINEVDKIDKDNYIVKAKVVGNYDIYETKLTICKKTIIDSSCTCEDYHKGYVCKHIIATAMETLEPHNASTDEGIKELEKKREEEAKIRLEKFKIKQRQELERRRYEQKYYNGLRTIESFKYENEDLAKDRILSLQEIYEQTKQIKKNNSNELATSIKLEFSVEYQNYQTLNVSFKIGQTRMYVLGNLSEFYRAYQNETELYYGKQLKLIPKRENFTEESRKVFDYVIKFAEMIEYDRRFNEYGSYNKLSNKEIYLTGSKIDEFFELNRNGKIKFKTSRGNPEFEFTKEKLDIFVVLKKEKIQTRLYSYLYEDINDESEEYVFRLNLEGYAILYSNEKIYIFYKKKIYTLEKTNSLVKLLNMFKDNEKILIPEDKLEEFKKIVLPKIKNIKVEGISDEFAKEVLMVNELASKILLDTDDKGNIILELKFCYNDYEFNILESGYKTYVKENNIVRDIPEETKVIKRIFLDGFELISGRKQFVMKNEDNIYEFLSNKIQVYMKDFEVLVTDKFKNKQIKQPKISNIGIRVESGLLELDISKINININEIKNILKDYNIKKKYHRLKNGDFLDLSNNEDLALLDEMGTTLDIDYSKIENGIVNLPMNRSMYLDKLMNLNEDISVSKNEKFTQLIDNIENKEVGKKIKIDKDFEKILRDYQKTGYKWLKTLDIYKFGGILADDMGLGKTLQVIALLKSELNSKSKNTSIVVCPSTLVLNWKAEIEKWCNEVKVLIIRGTADERKEKLNDYKNFDLIITSYDLLKRDVENYENMKFKYIIADEAQYIKNSTTQNATALKSLKGEVKFALTGTPIENSIAELWSIFDFIMPGYLYNYNKFKKKFEGPILKEEDTEALIRLKKLISPFILRRVKKDVLTELPEKNITVMKNEMESEQEKIYLSYLAQTKKEIAEELSDSTFEKSKFKILMLLTRLRQICCHPSLFIEKYKGDSGKLKQCMDLIVDAIESEHKILLFSSYTSMFDIIEKELKKLNIEYFKLVGNTPVSKRIEMVDEFNENEKVKIFLISLKAGGTGLNLTSADVVIHYDPWWNLSAENQATDRAYRIGQKNSVQVYKLITSNSIEEKINKMQERKEKLSKDVLSTEQTFISKMSKDEIMNLFE